METIGPYRPLRRLGGGGQTWLFACANSIAVKVCAPSERKRKRALRRGRPDPLPEALQAFNREAALLEEISGPGVIPLIGRGVTVEELPYFAMPLYAETVASRLWRDNFPRKVAEPLTVDAALQILRDVLEGARTLRRHGIVHRDIKPQNILLADDGRAVICDLGQAFSVAEADPIPIRNPGTFPYVAPELRSADVDGKADIYAIAMVAHLMFTGYLPGDGAALKQGRLPDNLVDWIEAALDHDPANRPDFLPEA